MTIDEALAILIDRIGWNDDKTVKGLVLSESAKLSNSSRYFQDEHSAVTLENIKDTQPIPTRTDAEFSSYLVDLKKRASRKVLTDAFEVDVIEDYVLDKYPRIFDNCISLQMVIIVSEQMMVSTRSNRIERLGKEFEQKLNYDIYRTTNDNKGQFLHSMGIATRYAYEIRSLQRKVGNSRNMLKTISKGQVENVYWKSNWRKFNG